MLKDLTMKHVLRFSWILSLLFLAPLAVAQYHAFLWMQSSGMQDLGTFPGWQGSYATAINRSGQIVGYAEKPVGRLADYAAFLWTAQRGLRAVQGVSSTSGYAYGINLSGQIVGSSLMANGENHAFLWTTGNGMQDLGTLGGTYSAAFGINNSGQVVGYSRLPGHQIYHAFLWTEGSGMQDLGTFGSPSCNCNSQAYGINDYGEIVGTSQNASQSFWRPVLWKGAKMQSLGTLGGQNSNAGAYAINNSEQIVGWTGVPRQVSSYSHAFLWSASTGMQDLGTLPTGNTSYALGINNSGSIVGFSGTTLGNRAFLWTPSGGMQDLGTLGQDSDAYGINDSGQVVGITSIQ
jgi:probable HAF family extracellular repeat protein